MSAAPVLAVRGLGKSYAAPVLRDVSLDVGAGQLHAVIGENGAGKSTLAKHLNGLLQPVAGQVLIGDWDTREHTAAQLARRVGYAFQNPDNQIFASSVHEEVAFGPHNLGFTPAETETAIDEALHALGLECNRRLALYR